MAEPSRAPDVQTSVAGAHFLIVEARFYESIGEMLLEGATQALEKAQARWTVARAPGALEIPAAAAILLDAAEKSGARVGQMWSKFVAEFRAAPIPKEWLQHGPSPYDGLTWDEIRAAYYEAIDKASEPWRLHAKGAYEACLSYSSKYQYFDDHSPRKTKYCLHLTYCICVSVVDRA